jgi:bifunctional DNase/RNase
MIADVIPVRVLELFQTEAQNVAVFIGSEDKCFIISVDAGVGRAIAMSMRGEKNERPLTHELMGHVFQAFAIRLERVVINDLRSNTYFARLILRAENEVHKKIIEIDARPSDCLALALAAQAPVFVARAVWEEVEDMTSTLERVRAAREDSPDRGKKQEESGDDLEF